jgi:hypothetical protein
MLFVFLTKYIFLIDISAIIYFLLSFIPTSFRTNHGNPITDGRTCDLPAYGETLFHMIPRHYLHLPFLLPSLPSWLFEPMTGIEPVTSSLPRMRSTI